MSKEASGRTSDYTLSTYPAKLLHGTCLAAAVSMNSSQPSPTTSLATSPTSMASPPGWVPVNRMVKSKKARAGKPKVRTGCRTCKIRRVKCDEQKPSCRRCLRFNGECDGYEVDNIRSSSKSFHHKPLASIAPKAMTSPGREPDIPLITFPDAWQHSVDDDSEQQYLRHFEEKTLYRCSEYLDESLWKHLVLPACQFGSIIRHIVIAIGALDRSLEDVNPTKRGIDIWNSSKEDLDSSVMPHYRFAMYYYERAVKDVRSTLSETYQDIQNTLVASLLFACFETYHDNHYTMLDDAHSGLKIVNARLPQFMKQGVIPASYLEGLLSSAPCAIEDELINAFARLDIVTMLLSKDKATTSHQQRKPTIVEICQLMPQVFLSVEEANMYWDLLWRKTLQYLDSTKPWNLVLGLEDSDKIRAGKSQESRLHNNHIISNEKDEDYLSSLLQWSSAFEPLFLDSQNFATQKDYTAATTLAVQSKACYLAVAAGFSGEMYYDSHLKTLKEILSLSETFMLCIKDRGYTNQATCSFERIVTRSIYTVARMCRDRGTRRKAILMLKSTPQREGSWDSLLMAKIATLSMEIEEQKREGQFVPERARIKTVRTTFNTQERTGKLFYARAKPDPGWEDVVEEVNFTW